MVVFRAALRALEPPNHFLVEPQEFGRSWEWAVPRPFGAIGRGVFSAGDAKRYLAVCTASRLVASRGSKAALGLDGNQHGHHERESDGARVTAHGLASDDTTQRNRLARTDGRPASR